MSRADDRPGSGRRASGPGQARLPAGISEIVPGELYVGPRPGPGQLEALAKAGISAVLCLQEEHEGQAPAPRIRAQLRWERAPLGDPQAGRSMSLETLGRAVERVRAWKAEGRRVYLHCQQGVSRAPTVAVAFLIAEYGRSLGEAMAQVRAARPSASISAQQLVVLSAYATRQRGSNPR